MKLFGNMEIKKNMMYIGKFSVQELKEKYGTPLYIVDETDFRSKCQMFRKHFASQKIKTEILYASKALLNQYIARVVMEEGLSIDVVSGGELYTVRKAGFPADRIYFHGNNKLEDELKLAIEERIGTIVIDNETEVDHLMRLMPKGYCQRVLVRVNPGIEAHTHEYITTSKNDSKFGLSIFDEDTIRILKKIIACDQFHFAGIHAHIGSQVFEQDSFFKECETMMEYAKSIQDAVGVPIEEINLGGGFGIYYTNEDRPFGYEVFLEEYVRHIEQCQEKYGLQLQKVSIEPGRSLISNSGSTLYTVGGVKRTYGNKNYVFIDGGMTDNIRPALYQAKYEAVVANRCEEIEDTIYTIAGKCCESGDVIIKDISLCECQKDDLILVASTGAYNYSMSMNYNRIPKPAMVFIGEECHLAVRRQTYEDLLREEYGGENEFI